MKNIKTILISLAVFIFVLAGQIVFASWTAPSADPTANNTEAPINISATVQSKTGLLGTTMFKSYGDVVGQINNMQIIASGDSNKNEGVTLGYDTSGNVGHIYSREIGAGPKPLIINGNTSVLGFVGIGTLAGILPSQKLDVNGNVKATQFCLGASCISDWASAGSQWITTGNNIYYNTGNVGIKNANPLGVLQVNLPSWTNRDTDSQHVIFGSGTSGYGLRFGYNESTNIGSINVLKSNVAWGNLILQDSGGNVGIGTTNPSERLDVSGNIKGTQLCIGSDCRNAWPTSGTTYTSGTNINIMGSAIHLTSAPFVSGLTVGGVTQVNTILSERTATINNGSSPSAIGLIVPNGNVGIGTTNPTSKFHILNGDLKIQNDSSWGKILLSKTNYGNNLVLEVLSSYDLRLKNDNNEFGRLSEQIVSFPDALGQFKRIAIGGSQNFTNTGQPQGGNSGSPSVDGIIVNQWTSCPSGSFVTGMRLVDVTNAKAAVQLQCSKFPTN